MKWVVKVMKSSLDQCIHLSQLGKDLADRRNTSSFLDNGQKSSAIFNH
jgi:hypothetical protein